MKIFFFCLKLGASEIIPTIEFFKQVARNICEIETLQTVKTAKRYVFKAKEYIKYVRGLEFHNERRETDKIVEDFFQKSLFIG